MGTLKRIQRERKRPLHCTSAINLRVPGRVECKLAPALFAQGHCPQSKPTFFRLINYHDKQWLYERKFGSMRLEECAMSSNLPSYCYRRSNNFAKTWCNAYGPRINQIGGKGLWIVCVFWEGGRAYLLRYLFLATFAVFLIYFSLFVHLRLCV